MSHITKLKTAITKQFILKETLKNLGMPWTQFDVESSINVDLKKNPRLEFAILQENGSNITFLWTGEVYEVAVDISKWQQTRSISGFMSKVEQTYAWTLLNTSVSNSGFNTTTEKVNSELGSEIIDTKRTEKSRVLVCKGWH